MATDMRTLSILCVTTIATLAPAQELRRGLVAADAVVVGRQVGKTEHDAALTLHRVQVVLHVRGAAGNAAVTVLDWPTLSMHNRPTPRQSRLYCLEDATAVATRLGLPTANGPYYKMVGWPGSNPLVGAEPANDASVRFAQVLAASDAGTNPAITAAAVCSTALAADVVLRTEATRFLTERADLRSKLSSVHWNQLLARATGEMEDMAYKIALAELCGEQRLDGVFDTLLVSLGQVTDAEFARTVGRIGAALHGEDSAARIDARLRTAGQLQDRAALLLALGASNTTAALDALQQMDSKDAAVAAGLKEHRAAKAPAPARK